MSFFKIKVPVVTYESKENQGKYGGNSSQPMLVIFFLDRKSDDGSNEHCICCEKYYEIYNSMLRQNKSNFGKEI